jgi:hypothetical protein
MTERPIIFSGPMVRAILKPCKSQTRSVVTRQNSSINGGPANKALWDALDFSRAWVDNGPSPAGNPGPYLKVPTRDDDPDYGGCVHRVYPQYQVGDVLWVRETWQHVFEDVRGRRYTDPRFVTGQYMCRNWIEYAATPRDDSEPPRWRSPIHMPRWASRLLLRVEDVRVQRVQEITEGDAQAEGVERLFTQEECDSVVGLIGTKPEDYGWKNYLWHGNLDVTSKQVNSWDHQYSSYSSAIGSFSSLWQKINGKRYPWASNPWVWAITFSVQEVKR